MMMARVASSCSPSAPTTPTRLGATMRPCPLMTRTPFVSIRRRTPSVTVCTTARCRAISLG